MKLRSALLLILLFLAARPVSAHGIGGGEGVGLHDYIELGGVVLVSMGLLLYSFSSWRQRKRKK
jgi:hypothetical protein